ncbi:hypothetical protein-transmembrane prediction [Rhodopirellula baltica SH 1]|uniref:Uncharacterized protein n=1 Tax=Rhodopirellula baltica (strain DSM 10527 / NCIMB 13988 / SH1) TaxID=243090 RepID=Q7UYA3_RHOBA|nr:hypothetical protein-transmembrane prediction [Rhodopirellula baltica SH 1]
MVLCLAGAWLRTCLCLTKRSRIQFVTPILVMFLLPRKQPRTEHWETVGITATEDDFYFAIAG